MQTAACDSSLIYLSDLYSVIIFNYLYICIYCAVDISASRGVTVLLILICTRPFTLFFLVCFFLRVVSVIASLCCEIFPSAGQHTHIHNQKSYKHRKKHLFVQSTCFCTQTFLKARKCTTMLISLDFFVTAPSFPSSTCLYDNVHRCFLY